MSSTAMITESSGSLSALPVLQETTSNWRWSYLILSCKNQCERNLFLFQRSLLEHQNMRQNLLEPLSGGWMVGCEQFCVSALVVPARAVLPPDSTTRG